MAEHWAVRRGSKKSHFFDSAGVFFTTEPRDFVRPAAFAVVGVLVSYFAGRAWRARRSERLNRASSCVSHPPVVHRAPLTRNRQSSARPKPSSSIEGSGSRSLLEGHSDVEVRQLRSALLRERTELHRIAQVCFGLLDMGGFASDTNSQRASIARIDSDASISRGACLRLPHSRSSHTPQHPRIPPCGGSIDRRRNTSLASNTAAYFLLVF